MNTPPSSKPAPHSRQPFTLLVLDLGNVVFRLGIDPLLALTSWSQDSPQLRVFRQIGKSQYYDAFERNQISSEEFITHALAQLSGELSREHFVSAWNSIIGEPVTGVFDWLQQLRTTVAVATLSNTNTLHFAHITTTYPNFVPSFDYLFPSFKLGLRKPQDEIFAKVEELTQTPAHRILYFDDLEENLLPAQARGWSTELCHVKGPKNIQDLLHLYFPHVVPFSST